MGLFKFLNSKFKIFQITVSLVILFALIVFIFYRFIFLIMNLNRVFSPGVPFTKKVEVNIGGLKSLEHKIGPVNLPRANQ